MLIYLKALLFAVSLSFNFTTIASTASPNNTNSVREVSVAVIFPRFKGSQTNAGQCSRTGTCGAIQNDRVRAPRNQNKSRRRRRRRSRSRRNRLIWYDCGSNSDGTTMRCSKRRTRRRR